MCVCVCVCVCCVCVCVSVCDMICVSMKGEDLQPTGLAFEGKTWYYKSSHMCEP